MFSLADLVRTPLDKIGSDKRVFFLDPADLDTTRAFRSIVDRWTRKKALDKKNSETLSINDHSFETPERYESSRTFPLDREKLNQTLALCRGSREGALGRGDNGSDCVVLAGSIPRK